VPTFAVDYNNRMNAVDIGDQLRSSLGYDHRIRRGGWQAIAWTFLLDISLINSYILQLKGKPAWEPFSTQLDWRDELVNKFCERYGKTGGSRQRFRAGDEFTPVSQHNHVNRGKNSPCLGCQGHQAGKPRSRSALQPLTQNALNCKGRRRSRWGCDVCDC